ncbi:MAG: hypothetical protein J6D37_07925 [Clostridia bacterium]|nr:hypothetical protein [Clostridia bacterium]
MKHVIKHRLLALCSAGLLALTTALAVAPQVQGNAESADDGNKTAVSERDLSKGYYESFNASDYFDFCTWLVQEKKLDLNNETDSDYINNNLNRLIFEAIDQEVIPDITVTNRNTRWYGESHNLILYYAIDKLLSIDGKKDVQDFYCEEATDTGDSRFNCLMKGASDPDTIENGGQYKGHFYCYNSSPSKNGNYYKNAAFGILDLATYSPSGRTRFEQHYESALYAWQAGYQSAAMNELGRAIHYLSDMCTPTHVTDWGRFHFNRHSQYELWVALVQPVDNMFNEDEDPYDYWLPSANHTFYVIGNASESAEMFSSYYNFVQNNSFETICNKIVKNTYRYTDYVEGATYHENKDEIMGDADLCNKYDLATERTLEVAQGMTAALLNRFYHDINHTQQIQDFETYYIKNVATGTYLSATADNKLTVSSSNNSSNQKFKLIYGKYNNGFTIYSIGIKKYLYYLEDNPFSFVGGVFAENGYYFMPVKGDSNKYRIMLGGIEGAFDLIGVDTHGNMDTVMSISGLFNDGVSYAGYNPDENKQLWEFIRA